jgi:MoxR-like ATPase
VSQEQIQAAARQLALVDQEVGKVLVGQKDMVEGILIGLLCDAHILLEGVPGLAKTTVITSLAKALSASFSRIQFTPDLLPADIIGTRIFEGGRFTVRKGPVFAQLVLADEINRAPAKVQSALLEAMQERQVTIGEESFPLPGPFLVMATQNPLEQEGTYQLPEAQTDRFLLKLLISYPSAAEERQVLDRALAPEPAQLQPVLSPEQLLEARRALDAVFIDDRLKDYIVALVRASRQPREAGIENMDGLIEVGASPRAVIGLAKAARAKALLQGHAYVTPQDIKEIAPAILRHRLIASYEAEAEDLTTDDLVQRLLEHVPVP